MWYCNVIIELERGDSVGAREHITQRQELTVRKRQTGVSLTIDQDDLTSAHVEL